MNNGTYVPMSTVYKESYGDTEYSAGDSTGGHRRVKFDPESGAEFYETLLTNFSYFIADQLIELGRKQAKYRDDAFSDEWINYTEKILFNRCPGPVSIEEMQTAIMRVLRSAEGSNVTRPFDLSGGMLADEIRQVQQDLRASPPSPKPRLDDHGARLLGILRDGGD